MHSINKVQVIKYLLDVTIITISFIICIHTTHYSNQPIYDFIHYLQPREILLLFLLIFIWFASAKSVKLYDDYRSRNYTYEIIAAIKNILIQFITLALLGFLLKKLEITRSFLIMYSVIVVCILLIKKYVIRQFLKKWRTQGRNTKNMMIIGAGPAGFKVYETIISNPQFGYKFMGFLDDVRPQNVNGYYLGPICQLENVLENQNINEIVIALSIEHSSKIKSIVETCENFTTRVKIIPDYLQFVSKRFDITMFDTIPIISVRNEKINELQWRIYKRIMDVIISMCVIITIYPWLFPMVILAIKIDSRGKIFFVQERWGRDNKKFKLYKFRSMKNGTNDVDDNGRYAQAGPNDKRFTRVGRILRKTNLDEFPQFVNVLKGDMSLVGPRPHPSHLNIESKAIIKKYMQRHLAKPGLTGWAQVNGYRGETRNVELMQKRIDYDLWYIENWSVWLDIQIILLTAWLMLKGDKNAY